MSSALGGLRLGSLALVLAWIVLAARARGASLPPPAFFAAAVLLVQGALLAAGLPKGRGARILALAGPLLDLAALAWLGASIPGGWALAPALVLPATALGLSLGPAAAALAAAAAAAPLGPPGEPLAAGLLRCGALALAPLGAALALRPARADAARRANALSARLRSAQVGEYLSFALFQLRDYAVTIGALAEALVLSPPEGREERAKRLKLAASQLAGKLSRVLGEQSAPATVVPPATAAVDVLGLARACAEDARAAFAPDGVQVSVVADGAAPEVSSDRRTLELALLAVLQNSLEACVARGGGAVSIVVRLAEGRAELEVADDGGGVPDAALDAAFEPFASARRGEHRLGLGLSMSRRLLERVGGSLRLKSRGGCTAALISVPLRRELPNIRLEESTWAGRRAESGGER